MQSQASILTGYVIIGSLVRLSFLLQGMGITFYLLE